MTFFMTLCSSVLFFLGGCAFSSVSSPIVSDPEGLTVGLVGLALCGTIWFVSRLAVVHGLLLGKPLPRLAFNIGSVAVLSVVLSRIPVWAYLEGAGAGALVSSFDWTQTISFWRDYLVLLFAIGSSVFILWVAKHSGGFPKFLLTVLSVLWMVTLILIDVQAQMTAGYNLRVQGTSEDAYVNYPVPACLQQQSLPGTSQAVWVLGTRDGQTVVAPRNQDWNPGDEPGRISSYPMNSFTLTMAAREAPNEVGCSSNQ